MDQTLKLVQELLTNGEFQKDVTSLPMGRRLIPENVAPTM